MQNILLPLESPDYHFLLGVIQSPISLTNDARLKSLLNDYEANPDIDRKKVFTEQLEKDIRFLGSSDLMFVFRKMQGNEPGATFAQIIRDVAKALKIKISVGTEREMMEELVEKYTTREFTKLSDEEKQKMLESLGVDRDLAAAFIKKSAGVFALPLMIEAFGSLVVNGLIKNIIFGLIGKVIGHQLAMRLFNFIMGRFPWWVHWIGPAAWTFSVGWTAFDIQGPSLRKTIPVVLYLGLCSIREGEQIQEVGAEGEKDS